MRSSEIEAVRKRASDSSRDGIVLVVYGDDAEALSAAEGAALDAVALRLPVTSIIWARDADGTGVSVYGLEGAPFGPRIPVDSELRARTKNRIQELAVLQGKAGMVLVGDESQAGGRARSGRCDPLPRQEGNWFPLAWRP